MSMTHMFVLSFNQNMTTKKRSTISIDVKYKIIKKLESGVHRKHVIKEFKINSRQMIHEIWKNKDKIKQRYEMMKKTDSQQCKYIRQSNNPQLEKALIKWFPQMRQSKVSLSGPVIKSKAIKYAEMLKINDFKASDGWFARDSN